MATLAPSLKALFRELDQAWPKRDHRTDGWIGDSRHCPGDSDHCADRSGIVHAIDIDKDGISPDWVVQKLIKFPGIVRYINWNRQQYHVRNNFAPRKYTGSNPHTDHIHVSIEHTDKARNFAAGWGIVASTRPPAPGVPGTPSPESAPFDPTSILRGWANSFKVAGDIMSHHATAISSIKK